MKMDFCDLCNGNCGWHARARQQLVDEAIADLTEAHVEVSALTYLYKHVILFNHDLSARSWKPPWRAVNDSSHVVLRGYARKESQRRGKIKRVSTRPVYYSGPIAQASPVPAAILCNEIKDAQKLVDELLTRVYDAETFAPGGLEYCKLLQGTQVGKTNSNVQ